MSDTANEQGARFGMIIDLSLCVGCNSCVVSCKEENDLPVASFNTWIESWDAGEYPAAKRANLPKMCNHCQDAPCVSVCPTGASYRTEDGIVLVDESRCIGCKYCMTACPYQVRWVNDGGAVEKCTFCANRSTHGLLPACVSNCPTHSRVFGDLNDPDSEVAKRFAEAETLLPEQGLDTRVRYVGLSKLLEQPVTSSVWHGGRTVKKLGEE